MSNESVFRGQGFFKNASNLVFYGTQMIDQGIQNSGIVSNSVFGNNNIVNIGDNKVQSWFNDPKRIQKIFWLHGPAGVGKSAIMQTLAEAEAESQSSTAFFGSAIFLSKLKERNQMKFLFNTIAYQLAVRFQLYREYVTRILTNDPQIVEKSMGKQFDLFIVRPFAQDGLLKGVFERVLVVLDRLDEADTIDAQRTLVSLIGRFVTDHPSSPLIWAIASRPEPDIIQSFQDLCQSPPSYTEIKIKIDSDKSRADMELFLRSRFDEIRKRYRTPRDWPSEVDFLKIAKASSGHFIYGEVVTRFVGDNEAANPISQLKLVIATIDSALSTAESDSNPFANLDLLYLHILSATPLKTRNVTTRLLALSFMECPVERFNKFWLISNWLQLSSEDAYAALRKLHSILHVPVADNVDKDTRLIPCHKSFADFILSPTRSGDFHVADPLRLALTGAVRVLDESCDPVSANIQVSRIKLHWAHKDKKGVSAVRRRCFSWSYYAVANYIQDALSCDDDAPIRLQAFFQSVDFAVSSYTGDQTISAILRFKENTLVFSVLESWGLARPITIQSIQISSVRIANAVETWAFWSSKQRTDVPSCLTESKHRWGKSPSSLAQYPDWKARLLAHLKTIENIERPARVYLLGQGSKSAVGIYQNLDTRYAWAYIIPYDQS